MRLVPTTWFILSAVIFVSTVAHSQSREADKMKVRIEGAWARRAPMFKGDSTAGSGNGAVYLTIVNPGSVSDDVIAASSDVAETGELHESYEESGMTMMRPIIKLHVPAGGKLEMKPGGYHIMLINLKRELKAGQVISVTLVLQKAGRVPVRATVK
jgi:periplasmic copper chaperone A